MQNREFDGLIIALVGRWRADAEPIAMHLFIRECCVVCLFADAEGQLLLIKRAFSQYEFNDLYCLRWAAFNGSWI